MVFMLILVGSSSAHANGAMGLGLEMFDLRYWCAYVLATVIVEAWLIGRYLKLKPGVSMLCSVLANAVTGAMCSVGCLAPFLHMTLVGSYTDPKPFANAVALLFAFAIPSALVEAIVWERATREKGNRKHVRWIVFVHVITVPLGLAILLIPSHPYRGQEIQARYFRPNARRTVEPLQNYITEHQQLPAGTSPRDVLRTLKALDPEVSEIAWFAPSFGRFSMGDLFDRPYELNRTLASLKVDFEKPYDESKWVWYVRYRWPDGHAEGLIVEAHSGDVKFSWDTKELGY